MEEQTVESNTNGELIKVIQNMIREVNGCSLFRCDEVCINNVIDKVSFMMDEYDDLRDQLNEAMGDSDYWEEEYSRMSRENSSLEDQINSLNCEIDDLKEQLSNKE